MEKPILSVVLTVLLASQANAEVNDLFLSEYVEGSSNKKAIEIANLSELEIDLTGYQLDIYYNGNSNSGLTVELQGVIPANDVFVFAHSSADEAILAIADQTSGAGLFNGDDAITFSNTGVIIDSLGQIGVDLGSQWGEGLTSTQNNTIRRILPLDLSDNNPNDSFDPSIEWLGFESNDFSNLGLLSNVVETPTMLLTGESDYLTPISESEQFYQALKLQKVPAAMVRIPDAGHGIYKRPSNLMSKVAHILWWFEREHRSLKEINK